MKKIFFKLFFFERLIEKYYRSSIKKIFQITKNISHYLSYIYSHFNTFHSFSSLIINSTISYCWSEHIFKNYDLYFCNSNHQKFTLIDIRRSLEFFFNSRDLYNISAMRILRIHFFFLQYFYLVENSSMYLKNDQYLIMFDITDSQGSVKFLNLSIQIWRWIYVDLRGLYYF